MSSQMTFPSPRKTGKFDKSPRKVLYKVSQPPIPILQPSGVYLSTIKAKPDESLYKEHDGIYNSTNLRRIQFNSDKSNRAEVKLLQKLTDENLRKIFRNQQEQNCSSLECCIEQVKVFDTSMREICELVNGHCHDQASLIWKIWTGIADLYLSIYFELVDKIRSQNVSIAEKEFLGKRWEEKAKLYRKTKSSKPITMLETCSYNNDQDTTIMRKLEEELIAKDKELREFQSILTNLSIWFPHFDKFGNSILSRFLPPVDNDNSPALRRLEEREAEIVDPLHSKLQDVVSKEKALLAQDYLLFDLKRLEELSIGFEVIQKQESPNNIATSNELKASLSTNHKHIEVTALNGEFLGGMRTSSTSFSSVVDNEYQLGNKFPNVSPRSSFISKQLTDDTVREYLDGISEKVSNLIKNSADVLGTSGVAGSYDLVNGFENQTGSTKSFHHAPARRLSKAFYSKNDGNIESDMLYTSQRENIASLEVRLQAVMKEIQTVELSKSEMRDKYEDEIFDLRKRLKDSQTREKMLKEQLSESRSEADTIVQCLPKLCFLPYVDSPETFSGPIKLSSYSLQSEHLKLFEVLKKLYNFCEDFTCESISKRGLIGRWDAGYLDNLFNGQNIHSLSIPPTVLLLDSEFFEKQTSQAKSIRSVFCSHLFQQNCQNIYDGKQSMKSIVNIVESACYLLKSKIIEDFQINKLKLKPKSSSLPPWHNNEDNHIENISSSDNVDSLLLSDIQIAISVLNLLGINYEVDFPELSNASAYYEESYLQVGIADNSYAFSANQTDDSCAFTGSQLSRGPMMPPFVYFSEHNIANQKIMFDVFVSLYSAAKGLLYNECGKDARVPISSIDRITRRVFRVLDEAPYEGLQYRLEEELLKEGSVRSKPWWRYITKRKFATLKAQLEHKAEFIDVNFASHDESEVCLQQNQRIPMVSYMQLFGCIMESIKDFEKLLRRLFKEMYSVLCSLIVKGPADPMFGNLLAVLCSSSPLSKFFVQDDGSNYHTLPLSLIQRLRTLQASASFNAQTFADTMLVLSPPNVIEAFTSIILINEEGSDRRDNVGSTSVDSVLAKLSAGGSVDDIVQMLKESNISMALRGSTNDETNSKLHRKGQLDRIDVTGNIVLQLLEVFLPDFASFMDATGQQNSFVNNRTSGSKARSEIPDSVPSYFANSFEYRKVLYSHMIDSSDCGLSVQEPLNVSANPTASSVSNASIKFAHRFLYQIRLCFDPNYLKIWQATANHKWFVLCVGMYMIGDKNRKVILDIEENLSKKDPKVRELVFEVKNAIKTASIDISSLENLSIEDSFKNNAAEMFYKRSSLRKTFGAWSRSILYL